MTREQLLIWAAGFFDGEGCVSIARNIDKRGAKTYTRYQMSVIVVQRDSAALDIFIRLFGGKLTKVYRRDYDGVYWQYKLYGVSALPMLEQILPYLVIKIGSASLAIEFQQMLTRTQPVSGQSRSQESLTNLELFYDANKVFNARFAKRDYTESFPQGKELSKIQ